MTNEELKKEAQRLMQMEGKTRGEGYSYGLYLQEKYGIEAVKIVEEKIKELGYPFSFKELGSFKKWYPEGLDVLIILVCKELFNWKDNDIFKLGQSVPKFSFILKILIKRFISTEKFLEKASEYWKRQVDVGRLEIGEYNKEKKHVILRLKEYNFHPIMCIYYAGIFFGIIQNAIQSPKITIEESKCFFRGDSFHEFIIKWV